MTIDEKSPYHHGDLRRALVLAAEAVLDDTGIEAFSLRRVAKAVGVSHSAPAHHFGDTQGLLSALATEGFTRFLHAMQARQTAAGPDPRDRAVASALGYLDFATASPALFRLMFGSKRILIDDPDLSEAAEASFQHLVANVAALTGQPPLETHEGMVEVCAQWSMVHGLAELFISGRMSRVQDMDPVTREQFFRDVFSKALT